MALIDMARAYVEKLLKEGMELDELEEDDDGDYVFRHGTAEYYVRVIDIKPPALAVFSTAVRGVRKSAKLLEEINSINSGLKFVRVSWCHDAVIVETELVVPSLDRFTLGNACARVGTTADEIGPMIASVYGGQVSFPPTSVSETAQ